MNSNSQKVPLGQSLNNVAIARIDDALNLLGRSIPVSVVSVSGAIVTLKIEIQSEFTLPQITCPIAESIYIRQPVQVGDKGIAIKCDTRLGSISGLGSAVIDFSRPSNLGSMIFLPVGNANWTAVNANMLVLTGISDVMLRDSAHQLQLEDENTSWNSLISQLNAWQTALAAHGITVSPITAINPVKARIP